jgi:uncharacterized protein (TIGR03437 family)
MPADILFFGLQPTYAGLYQINLRVPANAPVGTQLLSVTMGSITTSSTKITITNGP